MFSIFLSSKRTFVLLLKIFLSHHMFSSCGLVFNPGLAKSYKVWQTIYHRFNLYGSTQTIAVVALVLF